MGNPISQTGQIAEGQPCASTISYAIEEFRYSRCRIRILLRFIDLTPIVSPIAPKIEKIKYISIQKFTLILFKKFKASP
ncbi:MAG: hypothetical protein D6728_15135 [Cyanobacteria bacterium J055]|nr:MAG: hypothetical protein D6728_15135 [Cyanobacteria bacterium J055]